LNRELGFSTFYAEEPLFTFLHGVASSLDSLERGWVQENVPLLEPGALGRAASFQARDHHPRITLAEKYKATDAHIVHAGEQVREREAGSESREHSEQTRAGLARA
jgi:hypothetical protein